MHVRAPDRRRRSRRGPNVPVLRREARLRGGENVGKNSQIREIRVYYEDGSELHFGPFELDRLEKIDQVVALIDRARHLYATLHSLFGEVKE